MELTTVSLLDKRSEWERLGQHLPEGGLLIVVPEKNSEASPSLLKIAQSFRETGREVEIQAHGGSEVKSLAKEAFQRKMGLSSPPCQVHIRSQP